MAEKGSSSSSSGGIGFVGLLTIVFITLKLLGKIDWSWLWVISPIWISAALVIGFLLLVVGGAGVIALGAAGVGLLLEKRDSRRLREQRVLSIKERVDKARKVG